MKNEIQQKFNVGKNQINLEYNTCKKLLELFPETWTHFSNINQLQLRFNLKLAGVDYRTEEELALCLSGLETLGILKRDGLLIKRGILPSVSVMEA